MSASRVALRGCGGFDRPDSYANFAPATRFARASRRRCASVSLLSANSSRRHFHVQIHQTYSKESQIMKLSCIRSVGFAALLTAGNVTADTFTVTNTLVSGE